MATASYGMPYLPYDIYFHYLWCFFSLYAVVTSLYAVTFSLYEVHVVL